MTNREKKLWDILNKYGFSEWRKTRKCLFSDLTALISEHYVAKEEVDKMVSERCKNCKYRGLPDSINEALNSGDGVYRP